ncbi:MAG: serine hydrolase [Bacteroidetes bacterium]|nr:serine hydrolase [Bacteroidota bacterium]
MNFKLITATLLIALSHSVMAQPFLSSPKVDPYFLGQGTVWVDSIMNGLTLKQKIGQLFMVSAFSNQSDQHERDLQDLVEKYGIGGVIFFQGGPVRQARITNHLQAKTLVPLFVAMDAEWGVGMRLDSTISYPYEMSLGAIQDDELIYKMGLEIGRQLSRLGVQINFAPVVDINNNPDNPVIGFRSFGEDRERVTQFGGQYLKGLQDAGMIVTLKHFPGHGDTGTDSHNDLPVLSFDKKRLVDVELYPFKKLIDRGASGVMVSHMSIPALDKTPNLPSTLSKPIITGLLREELQFKGLIFTDALNMKGVTKYYKPGEIEVMGLIAGNDVLLYSEDVPTAIEAVFSAVDKGTITAQMVNEKCRKILEAKYFTGLSAFKPIETESLIEDLNEASARLLNRQLIERTISVLENKENVLPIGDLADLKIMSISIGNTEKTPFQEMLSKYTFIQHYNLDAKADDAAINEVEQQMKSYDLVIVGLHETRGRPFNSRIYSDGIYDLVSRVAASGKGIITSFRSPYTLMRITGIEKAHGLITTHQDSPLHEELAAQLIFGAIGAKGKLPVSIGDVYQLGDGLETTGGIRLKYTIPLETGINSRNLENRIDDIVIKGLNEKAFPGCQVLVAINQKVIFHKAYGHHTFEGDRSVKKDDIYDLASVTKTTAALAGLMKLHGEDKFNIDDQFGEYWNFGWNKKNKLSMREVLAHQSGLQSWIAYHTTTKRSNGTFKPKTLSHSSSEIFNVKLTDYLYLHKDYKEKIYKMIRKSPVDPDQGYVYSGLAFYLFPRVIQNISGIEFEDYLNRNFYKSLGANTLVFNPSRFYPLDRIIPTENDTYFRELQIHGVVHDEGAAMMSGVSGNAGLFGNADDLAKMWQMYLNMGSYGGKRYISEQTLREFSTCQYCEEGNRRGLGFDKPLVEYSYRASSVARQSSPSSFGHSGFTGTFVWVDPEYDLLYIFLSNRVYPTRENSKIYELNIRPDIHEVIYEEMGIL